MITPAMTWKVIITTRNTRQKRLDKIERIDRVAFFPRRLNP